MTADSSGGPTGSATGFRDFASAVRQSGRLGGENVVFLERVGSTNAYARRLVERLTASADDAAPESIVVAYQQTAGRGRLGRTWSSPPGLGLYTTWALPARSPRPDEFLATLPLLVGVALCEALADHLGPGVAGLKWPNDVMVRGRKLGGILIETVTSPASPALPALPAPWVLIGYGVNCGHRRDQLPTPTATSLLLECRGNQPPGLPGLFCDLVAGLRRELAVAGDLELAIERYRCHSVHRVGEAMVCRLGDRELRGAFCGFDERGRLRLEVGGTEELVASGDIVEAAPELGR